MAKKPEKEQKVKKIVTVKDLAAEWGVSDREARVFIRSLGLRAPEVKNRKGFGPRAKYEWPEDSPELAKIRQAAAEAHKNEDNEDDEDEEDDSE